MQKINYITTAYEVAKKDLPTEGFEFDKLWKIVAKHLDMKQETFKNELLGDFYTDLLQSGDFVFIGDNMWILRENIAYDRYQKIRDSITDKDFNLSDAEYGGYSPEEVDNLENDFEDKDLENEDEEQDDDIVDSYDSDDEDKSDSDDENDLDSDYDDEEEENN